MACYMLSMRALPQQVCFMTGTNLCDVAALNIPCCGACLTAVAWTTMQNCMLWLYECLQDACRMHAKLHLIRTVETTADCELRDTAGQSVTLCEAC